MAILGVLLGITMTVLGCVIWWGRLQTAELKAAVAAADGRYKDLANRLVTLANRKAATEPKPVESMNAPIVRRRWNPDVEAAS